MLNYGQIMVKLWSNRGQIMVKSQSNPGQILVKSRSNHDDQIKVKSDLSKVFFCLIKQIMDMISNLRSAAATSGGTGTGASNGTAFLMDTTVPDSASSETVHFTVIGGKFKFQAQDSFLEYSFFEIWRSEKISSHFLKKSHL